MTEMTIYNNQLTGAQQQFSPALIDNFIAWIDRSEKTAHSYVTNLRQFLAWLRFAEVRNPARQDVINYRSWLLSEHEAIIFDPTTAAGWDFRTDRAGNRIKMTCKPNTAAQYLRSVCQLFKWTAANGLYPDIAANIHAPKVKHDTHRKDALTAAEVLTIERSITLEASKKQAAAADARKDTAGRLQRSTEQGKRLYAMYLLAVNCGLRTIEISRANIKDLETKSGQTWLYVWGKGHTEPDQKKAIAPEVAEAIRDYISSRTDKPTGNSPLFVSTGNRSRGKRIAPTTISTMLKQAMQAAGYDSERLTAHSLRHTAGTAVQELTGDLYATQKYMRHANPATTEIYLHTNTEKADADIARRLYDFYHGGADQAGRDDSSADLAQVIKGLNAQQLQQLAALAVAMA